MNELSNISFDKLLAIYTKYFSLGYLGNDNNDKLAIIALVCYVTNELNKKGKNLTCYDVLLQIGKDFPDYVKNTFFKSLGVICQDLMYCCKIFPDFGLQPKEMPKTILKLLKSYCPF